MESSNEINQEENDLRSKIRHSIDGKKRVKLDKFVFLQRLGGGNYGDVYKAVHTQSEKNFAIKIIDKQKLLKKNKDPYVRQDLQRLLKSQGPLMQQCNSPHVLKCYDIKQDQRHKIFVLQFCNRGSLHEELKKRKAYPVNDALAILKQIIMGLAVNICQQLKELHKNRIIHRDLKTENIMIHNGRYKIADFGFSKQIDNQTSISKHTVLGTKITMAPQVKLNQKYGIKADIWSLGIIFFTMICSDVPFESQKGAGRSLRIQQQIALGKQLFFDTVEGQPDMQLKEFIKQMLMIDQRNRISWRELINHKIFERTDARIFQNPILNVKIGRVGMEDKESDDKGMSAKEHQARLLEIGEKEEKLQEAKHQNIQIAERIANNLASKLTVIVDDLETSNDNHSHPESMSNKQVQRQREISNEQPKRDISNQQSSPDMKKEQPYRDMNNKQSHRDMKREHSDTAIDIQIHQVSNLAPYSQKSDIEKTIFHLIQLNNLECHKAQYIYEKLILPLENHQMLDLDRRSHHQLLYLMITRCWINVSWATNNLHKFQNHQIMLNYHQQLNLLYTKIKMKWKQIQQQLLKVQNSIKYILKDVGSSVFSRNAHKTLKKFMCGIETAAYTKAEQIEYTQGVYIGKIVNQLRGKQGDVFQMKRRLLSYKRVNEISLQELQERGDTFDLRVKSVMMY